MNTVVIVPQPIQLPSTTTHEFKAVTPAGREITISVRANIEIADEAVLKDLRGALSSETANTLREVTELPAWEVIARTLGGTALLWAVVTVCGMLLGMILDAAGFYPFSGPAFWESGRTFWQGLFRFWVLCLPVMIVIGMVVAAIRKKRQETPEVATLIEPGFNIRNAFHNMRLMMIWGVLGAMLVGLVVLAVLAYQVDEKLEAARGVIEHPVATSLSGPVSVSLLSLQASGCVAKGPDGGSFLLGPVNNGGVMIPKGSSFTPACFKSQPQ